MTKAQFNSNLQKTKAQVILEYLLLALCLCVIALRATFTEGLNVQSANQIGQFSGSIFSLSISTVLFLALVCWFILAACGKGFLYRFTGMEIGLCLFCAAVVIAVLAAANKRAAITNSVVFIAPLLCAILLVQILDSSLKIKLLLVTIAALGVASAYQCAEQFFVSNQVMIEQYEQTPKTILEPLGIQTGTFAHMLFEHRLYSRGVRGFFTTANSAGSFALLASFAVIALFIKKMRSVSFPRKRESISQFFLCGIAVAAVFFGLIITRSKGAIAASLIAAVMFITFFYFGNWLKTYRKAILIICLLLIVSGGCMVVLYGLTHDRLPGGNSMLVRWQYWRSAVKMYADHLFTGVGPGNFASFYPHYKPASALETVADPHNFLLSILTQYGPLGLVGFLTMICVPLWRVVFPGVANASPETHRSEPAFKKLAIVFAIIISAALLLIRPVIMPVAATETLDVMIYVILTLYVAPVAAFIIGFLLLTAPLYSTRSAIHEPRTTKIPAAALFCAVIGLLIHNLIDFAIFEPGVFTAFWAVMACLIAMDFEQNNRLQFVLKPAPFVRVIMTVGALAIVWAYFNYCFIPVVKSNAKIQQARRATTAGQFGRAHNLLANGAKDDILSPVAPSVNGRLYLQRFRTYEPEQPNLLLHSEKCLFNAIDRNEADYKNFERLAEVYNLLAENATQTQQRDDWLNKSFANASRAVKLYPGCGRLRIELAKVAEQLGKTGIAIENYEKAIEIEDSYRRQFQLMYPGRRIFCRLGQGKYDNAKKRIEQLTKRTTP